MFSAGFGGGERMRTYLEQLQGKLHANAGKKPDVRVGFLENSTCGQDNSAPAPSVAFINEFGAPAAGIPARPFFRRTVEIHSPKWPELLAVALKKHGNEILPALDMVGLKIGEQIQRQIELTTDPPNAESTKTKKGFDSPLQDSKNMKRAVSHEVVG